LSNKQLQAYHLFDDFQLRAAPAGHKFSKFASDDLVLQATMLGQEIDPNKLKAAGFAAEQHFPITANDLIANYQGPALGLKLRELENRWIDSNFSLSKDELLD
jgi:poly(A) polymerase